MRFATFSGTIEPSTHLWHIPYQTLQNVCRAAITRSVPTQKTVISCDAAIKATGEKSKRQSVFVTSSTMIRRSAFCGVLGGGRKTEQAKRGLRRVQCLKLRQTTGSRCIIQLQCRCRWQRIRRSLNLCDSEESPGSAEHDGG